MEYFILKPDGEQTGTFSIDQIRAMLNTGFIGLDTRYWHEGITEWQPVERIEESLNFPEPDAHTRHAPPPVVRKLSGSLARAIPSPHQQKRAAAAGPAGSVPPPADKASSPGMPVKGAEIPSPSLRLDPAALGNNSHGPVVEEAEWDEFEEPPPPLAHQPPAPPRPRKKAPLGFWIYAVPTILLTIVVITAVVLSRHPAKSPLSKVSLTAANTYVLLEQTSIKTFADDMRNSPVAESLQRDANASTDPVFAQRIKIGLEKENARHSLEITQQYIRDGKAQFIEPGTYTAVAYFDDNGTLTPARPGLPWVAINYHGNVVFAYQGTEFDLKPQ